MEQLQKVAILVIGYDEIKDYRQFKIAVLKSVNLNCVNKIYYINKSGFTEEIEKFCKEFKVETESMNPLPSKPSNEQCEKLSEIKALIVFNNGEDKRIKKYEAFAKKLPVYVSTWKTKDGNLILK